MSAQTKVRPVREAYVQRGLCVGMKVRPNRDVYFLKTTSHSFHRCRLTETAEY